MFCQYVLSRYTFFFLNQAISKSSFILRVLFSFNLLFNTTTTTTKKQVTFKKIIILIFSLCAYFHCHNLYVNSITLFL